jgi:hypothetical protein
MRRLAHEITVSPQQVSTSASTTKKAAYLTSELQIDSPCIGFIFPFTCRSDTDWFGLVDALFHGSNAARIVLATFILGTVKCVAGAEWYTCLLISARASIYEGLCEKPARKACSIESCSQYRGDQR